VSPLTYEQAWDHLNPDRPICDGCRRPLIRPEEQRSLANNLPSDPVMRGQLGALARRGINNIVCRDCTERACVLGSNRVANVIEACVARASVPNPTQGAGHMPDTPQPTEPFVPGAAGPAPVVDVAAPTTPDAPAHSEAQPAVPATAENVVPAPEPGAKMDPPPTTSVE
jgi:hypothetical protein